MCLDCLEEERRTASEIAKDRDALRHHVLSEQLEDTKEFGVSIQRFSFTDAIYLVSVIRGFASEDLSYIIPIGSSPTALAPTEELDCEIVKQLYRNRVLCIHPGTGRDSVKVEGAELVSYYPLDVHWILPLAEDGPSALQIIDTLESALRSQEWPDGWRAEADDLHRTVALHECLQYLQIVLEEHGFEGRAGEKTRQVLGSVLQSFSIGQVYNMIWRAGRDAAAFYLRKASSRTHAANIVPGSVQSFAERAITEGWDVKPFRRHFDAPANQLSQVLFTTALNLADEGFTAIPPSACQTTQ